jgi:hypothetical protein
MEKQQLAKKDETLDPKNWQAMRATVARWITLTGSPVQRAISWETSRRS